MAHRALLNGFSSFLSRERTNSTTSNPTIDVSESSQGPVLPLQSSSSSIYSPAPEIDQQLDPLVLAQRELIAALETLQVVHRSAYSERLASILAIQLILSSYPSTRSTFGQHNGGVTLLSVLASLEESGGTHEGLDSPELRADLRYELVKLVFSILALSFQSNPQNRALFVGQVGLAAVEAAIDLSGLMGQQPGESTTTRRQSMISGSTSPGSEDSSIAFEEAVEGLDELISVPDIASPAEKLLSILYAFLINDFLSTPIYSAMRLRLLETTAATIPTDTTSTLAVTAPIKRSSSTTRQATITQLFAPRTHERALEAVENPEIISLIFSLQAQIAVSEPDLAFMVLTSIERLAVSSRRSQIALGEAGVNHIVLSRLFPSRIAASAAVSLTVDGEERLLLKRICTRLLSLGADALETRTMFQNVVTGWQDDSGHEKLDDEMLALILASVQTSRLPSFIHFDLSTHGHSSLSLPSLGRVFPPVNSGYTYLAWISVGTAPTTNDEKLIIFGCGDSSRRCFVELSLSPSLRLSLSTSIARPATTFRSFTFETGRFYQIAIVHQRPKFSSTSSVTLYVDGTLVEVAKAHYPASAPKDVDIQAWMGTPKDRQPTSMIGKAKSTLKWDLGPSWLVEGDVPEEMIFVCATLGPRYSSNFQDQLGQFQTNRTSALLNVKLDASSKKDAANSPLITAISSKGSLVLPESQLYFSFFATNVLTLSTSRGIAASGLSQNARSALASVLTAARGSLIVNSAVPRLESILSLSHGIGYLDGVPAIANPNGLDLGIWETGGVAVVLRLVELSTTVEQLTQTVQLFIELVSESWRNSEDSERIQGYEILAMHLRTHAGLMGPQTHDALFAFVGYDFFDRNKSIVANPLACRFLLLDLSLWSAMRPVIQVAHFDRLREFVIGTEFKEFNMRRLSKMHLTRKLLFCLRVNYYERTMLDEVVDTLMLVVRSHFTTEAVRHLATFLTATLCQGTAVAVNRQEENDEPCVHFVLDASAIAGGSCRPSLRVLERLHDLLLDPEESEELAKFAKIITTKWILLFLLDRKAHPFAAVLALRILVRLLQTQGPTYETKFVNSSDGFAVLRSSLPQLWNYSQIHLALFALLHGHDITTIPLNATFSPHTFEIPRTLDESAEFGLEVYRIVIACLGRGIHTMIIQNENSASSTPVAPQIPEFAVTAPDATAAELEAPMSPVIERTSSLSPLPLGDGFDILLDLLGAANRTTTGVSSFATTISSLLEFIVAIRPFLELETLPTQSTTLPVLPILKASNGFTLPDDGIVLVGAGVEAPDTMSVSSLAESNEPLETKDDSSSEPVQILGASARTAVQSLLAFFGDRIAEAIALSGATTITKSVQTDPGLQILLDTLDAARTSSDMAQQVTVRTRLLKHVTEYLASTGVLYAAPNRIGDYIEFATSLSFQGWYADTGSLLDLVLCYIERLLEGDGVLTTSALEAAPLGTLFQSLNRLVLLSLYSGDSIVDGVLQLLTRHQLSIFAGQNTDVDFFRCLVQRLDFLVRTATEVTDSMPSIDLFKLLMIERHVDVEVALGVSYYHSSEARLVDKLINSDNTTFVKLLEENRDALSALDLVWSSFVECEVSRASADVTTEVALINKRSAEYLKTTDLHARRNKKHRASVYEWSEGIHEVEYTRVAHTKQDIADHASFVETEWVEQLGRLQRECGIWGESHLARRWRLDFTEGASRMRKKLQADRSNRAIQRRQSQGELLSSGERVSRQDSMSVWPKHAPGADTSKDLASPISPREEVIWGESFRPMPSTAEAIEPAENDNGLSEEHVCEVVDEDKNRKVRRSLEPGDVILSVFNISRIVGLHACGGLLLLAKRNIYLVDGFFQKQSGELVDAWDAPQEERDQHLQTLADLAGRNSKSTVDNFDAAHRSRRWTYAELLEVHERKYLFRNVALELFFSDGRSFLITFGDKQRAYAYDMLATKSPAAVEFGSLHVTAGSLRSKMSEVVRGQRTKLERMTRRWERREVSNFDYLMFLNTCAGRTYNDLTNYPVFPWILADYESETLDLNDPKSFRDLSKPMGAQSEPRRTEFQERYAQLSELDDGTKPFNYGTHYSSAMIVVGYLVRLSPFTSSYLDLQGGAFDHADRMFWSISKAWDSCSKQSRSDVRELIPEFFYLPDFLRNTDGLELGTRQENGAGIDNVDLPAWANGDPRRFVELHREALESEYVSVNLSAWVDLIFGYRSSGAQAVEAVNVFHHLSYEGAIDLDAIEDANERRAATSTIHNFGMTPRQLFSKPHPTRITLLLARATHPLFSPDSYVEQQSIALIQCIVPVTSIGQQVATIYPSSTTPHKTLASPSQSLLLPDDPTYSISWGFADQTVRLHATKSNTPINIYEGMHSDFVSAACFADAHTFVTGSTDTNVVLWEWRWNVRGRDGHLQRLDCLRGHTDQVCCVAASRTFSIVVSGSDDRTAIIWDLNRHRFVRSLEGHDHPVQLVAISDATGDIATCSGATLRVWTVNGELLAVQSTSNFVDPITAVAFSKAEVSPIIATGHRGGTISTWRRIPSKDATGWKLQLVATLTSKDRLAQNPTSPSAITALRFTTRTLYSGDAAGAVQLWSPPGTDAVFTPETALCQQCETKFGIIESRRRCMACGGCFCSSCTTTSIEIGCRLCSSCFRALSILTLPL